MQSFIRRAFFFFILVLPAARAFGQAGVVPAAGNGTAGYSGDGGPASSAELNVPSDVSMDAAGNLYIPDRNNNRVRKLTASTGTIDTVAGNGTIGVVFDESGSATAASLNQPFATALDGSGNLYIADFNFLTDIEQNRTSRIHQVNLAAGTIRTIDTSSPLRGLLSLAVDGAGNLYVAEHTGQKIFRVSPDSGAITVVAGTGVVGFSGDGGPATSAMIASPSHMTFDAAGNLYFADTLNARVRKIAAGSNIISTVAGISAIGFAGDDGPATAAQLNTPTGVAVDAAGNVFIADSGNQRIRRVSAGSGLITTVIAPAINGICGVFAAPLQSPQSLVVNAAGSLLYIADLGANRIWKANLNPTPDAPTLASIAPPSGAPGTLVTVTLTGTGFAGNVTPGCTTGAANVAVSGAGISVGTVTVGSDTSMTAVLIITSGAALGVHNVTVSTIGGTTSPLPFNVAVAMAPPPTLTSIAPSSGVQGTSVTVTLTGTNFDTHAGNTTVTADGTGISVSGVTAGSATTLTAVLAISGGATLGTHNLKVSTLSGSSGPVVFNVLPGGLSFVYNMPAIMNPTDQVPVQVALSAASPNSVTGMLSLTFTPNATNPADDPNVTFVNADTSGRNSAVTFPANIVAGHLGMPDSVLQAGTVAGTIELTITNVQSGTANVNATGTTFDIQIPRLPPVITSARIVNRTGSGFDLEVTGYSTTRDITGATFDFGAATGQKLLTLELKPDVNSPFTVYYQSPASDPAGSAFVYTQPFIIKQGTVNAVASVTVTLANSAGSSQPATAE
jgi:sugar lactone lactonase YvrE